MPDGLVMINKKIIRSLIGAIVLASGLAAANEVAVAPLVDAAGLPALGMGWRTTNPYRGLAAAVDTGRLAFNQACARCHGVDADAAGLPAPDLRQLNAYCRRIADPELNAACMRDNDAFFARSVRQGKIIVGVTHMPPWEGILKQELAWAIQVFIESRSAGKR